MTCKSSTTTCAAVVAQIFMLLSCATAAAVDCATVAELVSSCSVFIRYGSPDPRPGSPCCDAVWSLNNLGDTVDSRRGTCRCIVGLITAVYDPNATAIAALPGFCGVSLGFTIDPNVNCNKLV